jgi:hypothetical protein
MRKEEFKASAHLFFTNDCACAVPPPQSALSPTKCHPPPITSFLLIRKEEFKGFAHLFCTNDCGCALRNSSSTIYFFPKGNFSLFDRNERVNLTKPSADLRKIPFIVN